MKKKTTSQKVGSPVFMAMAQGRFPNKTFKDKSKYSRKVKHPSKNAEAWA